MAPNRGKGRKEQNRGKGRRNEGRKEGTEGARKGARAQQQGLTRNIPVALRISSIGHRRCRRPLRALVFDPVEGELLRPQVELPAGAERPLFAISPLLDAPGTDFLYLWSADSQGGLLSVYSMATGKKVCPQRSLSLLMVWVMALVAPLANAPSLCAPDAPLGSQVKKLQILGKENRNAKVTSPAVTHDHSMLAVGTIDDFKACCVPLNERRAAGICRSCRRARSYPQSVCAALRRAEAISLPRRGTALLMRDAVPDPRQIEPLKRSSGRRALHPCGPLRAA